MPDGVRSHDSLVFTSWKEIAAYLGKGVRTVQRWEAQFGLPVRRPNTHAKGMVRATKEDLDQWIATRWSPRSGTFDLPDAPIATRPVEANVQSTWLELQRKNNALLAGLQQSIDRLVHNCENLALNVQLSRELRGWPSSSVITGNRFVRSYRHREQVKAS